MDKVLVIAGPTAVGKTAFSIQCAKRFNGEIISGDSMQVYRTLNIGTAKIKEEEMDGIKHHLIDVCDPDESYSVADFQKEGRQAIQEIIAKGKLPVIVGGTGLYLQALLYDFHLGGQEEKIPVAKKEELSQFLKEQGRDALWQRLFLQDEQAAQAIHKNNERRVLRALEVVETTGKPFLQKEEQAPLYDHKLLILNTERETLYERINQRVDGMLEAGLLEEAKYVASLKKGTSRQSIGYKEFFPYFSGEQTLEEAVATLKQNSRRYAKRQLTWFRNRFNGEWIDLLNQQPSEEEVFAMIEQWLGGE